MTHENPQEEDAPKLERKYQKKYFSTPKGKTARRRAEKAYDRRDIERRRKQKRDYMRRKRLKDPDIWRY